MKSVAHISALLFLLATVALSSCAAQGGSAGCDASAVRALMQRVRTIDERMPKLHAMVKVLRTDLRNARDPRMVCVKRNGLTPAENAAYVQTLLIEDSDGAQIMYAAGNYRAAAAFVDKFVSLALLARMAASREPWTQVQAVAQQRATIMQVYQAKLRNRGYLTGQTDLLSAMSN